MKLTFFRKFIATVSLGLVIILGTSVVSFANWFQKEWFDFGDYKIHHKGWTDSSAWYTKCDQDWKSCTGWTQGYRKRDDARVSTSTTAELRNGDSKFSSGRKYSPRNGEQSHATVEITGCGSRDYTGYTHWDLA